MGVELTLMPVYTKKGWVCAHDRLELGRDYDLWEQIKMIPQKIPPMPLAIYSGDKYGTRTETPYGEPIMYVLAGDLAKIALPADSGFRNRAAWAYLAQMPADWPVLLYWH